MKWGRFGNKHLRFIATPYNKHKRITVLSGSVRSGKTITMIPKFLQVIENAPEGLGVIVGVSKDTIMDNVLRDLFETIGENSYKYNSGTGELKIGNRIIKVIGAKDAGSEKAIRGKTLAFAYVDELTLINKEFFYQLLNRCSLQGAKVFATTNPDSPYHYIYEQYINNPERSDMVELWTFTLDDNPNLPQEYKEFVSRAYSGVFYDRMILGKWVIADGIIYDMFNPDMHVIDELPDYFEEYNVAGDFGTQNPTAFGLFGKSGDKHYLIKEYHYCGREEKVQKTPEQYVKDYKDWVGDIYVNNIVLDPSATPLIAAFENAGYYNIKKANNDVLDGIQRVSEALNNERFYVHSSCENAIKEFGLYCWDTKAAQRGIDTPLKINDHVSDLIRYYFNTVVNGPEFFTFDRADWGL